MNLIWPLIQFVGWILVGYYALVYFLMFVVWLYITAAKILDKIYDGD